MDSGPNAYTLLGFATVDVNHPTLTPIRNERAVLMLQKSDSAWNDVLVREPWRDCNKLYSSIRGIVLGESQCMNLEDFGITEKEIVKPKVESACTEDLSSFQHFLGGAWVGTPSMLISVLSFNVASELATEFQVGKSDPDVLLWALSCIYSLQQHNQLVNTEEAENPSATHETDGGTAGNR